LIKLQVHNTQNSYPFRYSLVLTSDLGQLSLHLPICLYLYGQLHGRWMALAIVGQNTSSSSFTGIWPNDKCDN